MANKRLLYIDELKGFAIILVVMGHALERNGYGDQHLYNIIYSFHMPLFFCISGFVSMYSCKLNVDSPLRDYWYNIYKTFLTILLPCLVWSLIVNPLFFSRSLVEFKTLEIAFETTFINNGGYWFLPCLFILRLLFYLWKYVSNRLKLDNVCFDLFTIFILLGGVISLSANDYMRSVSSYFLPFFFGVLICKYERLKDLIFTNNNVYAISFITFCFIAGFFGNSNIGIMNKLFRLMSGIFGTIVLFNFFSNFKFSMIITNTFSYLGKYTLIIYLLHFAFINGITLPNNMGIWLQLISYFFVAIMICFTCVMVAKMLENSPILSFLMLGKKVDRDR